jgi:anti-repressor protein
VTVDGASHFVGKDVADRLGYADPTTAIRSHCRGVQKLHPILDSLGRKQEVRVLAEPDVLRLIVGSRLPAAERFERWVFEEVLPAIRKA